MFERVLNTPLVFWMIRVLHVGSGWQESYFSKKQNLFWNFSFFEIVLYELCFVMMIMTGAIE